MGSELETINPNPKGSQQGTQWGSCFGLYLQPLVEDVHPKLHRLEPHRSGCFRI